MVDRNYVRTSLYKNASRLSCDGGYWFGIFGDC